jgi:hypothetical protein
LPVTVYYCALAEDALLLVLQLPLIIEVGSIKAYIPFSR